MTTLLIGMTLGVCLGSVVAWMILLKMHGRRAVDWRAMAVSFGVSMVALFVWTLIFYS